MRRVATIGCAIALCLTFAAPAMGIGEPALVRDINLGPANSMIDYPAAFDGRLYFSADDGTHGSELWSSDGTEAGTNLVVDIVSGSGSSFPIGMTDIFGELGFRANDGIHGAEPWASDGTAAGTAMTADINEGATTSDPRNLALADGRAFFVANDGTTGLELWLYQGGQATLVKDVNPAPGASGVQGLGTVVAVGDTAYFGGNDGTGLRLWKSDGTPAGTVPVSDEVFANFSFTPLLAWGDKLLFSALVVGDGTELWISDGTPAGTEMVKDINPGASGSLPDQMVNVDGTILFAASDGTHGKELWRTDGTPEGTEMVKDINPGPLASIAANQAYPVVVGDTAYFAAGDSAEGRELWRSDGTAVGTKLVEDIRTGPDSSSPAFLRVVDGNVLFAANDGTNGRELWLMDEDDAEVKMVADIFEGLGSSSPEQLTPVGTDLFFTADDGTHGRELWRLQLDIPPVAVDDSATVVEDAPAAVVDVLANDIDADGGPKSIGSVTQPLNGQVAITGGGTGLTYRPNPDYCNDGAPTDDFTYTLSPGGDTATVAMTVVCVDDPLPPGDPPSPPSPPQPSRPAEPATPTEPSGGRNRRCERRGDGSQGDRSAERPLPGRGRLHGTRHSRGAAAPPRQAAPPGCARRQALRDPAGEVEDAAYPAQPRRPLPPCQVAHRSPPRQARGHRHQAAHGHGQALVV